MPGRIIHTLLVLMFLSGFNIHAKGYVFYGAEIYYVHTTGSYYNINVIVYAPCVSLPVTSYLKITDGSTSQSYALPNVAAIDITPVSKGQCDYCTNSGCNLNFGVKKYLYTENADLKIFSGCNLTLSWTYCCGDTVTNSSMSYPDIYLECKLNRCKSEASSPDFLFDPTVAVNMNYPVDNFQVVKPSDANDSIVYRLTAPKYNSGNTIPYNSGFNYLEPMTYAGNSPKNARPEGFHYDAVTGEFWFASQKAESSWLVMEADEYTKDANNKYYLLGSTMRINKIRSFYFSNSNKKPVRIDRTDGSNSDTLIACANVPVTFSIKTYDTDGDSVSVEQYCETPAGLTFTPYYQYYKGSFTWTPANSSVRKAPYRIIITAKDHEKPFYNSTQRIFYVFVKGSLPVFNVTAQGYGCGNYNFGTAIPIDTANHVSYQWYFDSTRISNSASGTYKSNLAGTHNISLTISNKSGCTETASATAYFDTALQKLPAQLGLCKGNTLQLHAANASNLTWYPKTGLSGSNIPDPVASPSATTIYTVTGKDIAGCTWTDKVKINVADYNLKTCGDRYSCSGAPVKLWANYIPGAVYSWDPDSLLSKAYYLDTIIAYPAISTKFRLTVSDSGCVKSDSLMVHISPTNIDLGPPLSVCPGDSFTITAPLIKGAAYQWMDAQHNTIIPGATSTIFRYIAGTYRPNGQFFGVIVTDSLGCTATGTKKIDIKPFAPAVTGNTYICKGDTSYLKLLSGNKYSWKSSGFFSKSAFIKISPGRSAIYSFSIADTILGCSYTDSVTVDVKERPSAAFHSISICTGDSVRLGVTGGTSYSWSPSKMLDFKTAASPLAFPAATTTYHVIIKDFTNNCIQDDSILVQVNDCVWPGDANRDGSADYLDVLNIGAGAGTMGPSRDSGTIQWQRYQAKDWPQSTGTGINFKHLDCNGDGIINAADTAIVTANHQAKPFKYADHGNPADPPVYFKFARDTFYGGETAVAYLYAGTGSHSLTNAYGIAYQVSYKADSILQGSAWFTPVCDYFCNGSEIQYQALPYVPQSFVHTTVATNGAPSKNTAGQVAVLKFNLKDTLAFDYNKPKKIYANILTVKVIDNNGNILGVYTINDSAVVVRPKRIRTKPRADFVSNRSDCEPLTVKFKENASDSGGNIIKYEWDFGDGSPHSFLPDPVHNYRITNGAAIQEYNVRLTVMDDHGYTNEVTKAKWIVVLGSPKPVITVNPVMTTLDNPTIHFYISPQSMNLDTLDPVTTYEWHFGDIHNPDEGGHSNLMSPEYSYSDTGTYTIRLKVTNNIGCTDSAITTGLFYIKRGFSVFIPNVFIPNGRSKNEVFKPVISACPSYEIMIFNRWNQVVFESKNPDTGWDGTVKGNKAPEGVYFYQIKATNLAGKEFEYKGNITLIR